MAWEKNMQRLWNWLSNPPTEGPAAILLLRLMTGAVFFWEGILKFVYPNQGVGRFTKIGIPFPAASAHFVGCFEIIGGALLVAGLLTRFVSVPFVFQMIVAVLTTKVALFLGTSPLALPPVPPQVGIWAVLHEIRSDYAQIVTCLFFCIAGPGPLSLDAISSAHAQPRRVPSASPG
jgi:putative oxidoreductase